MEDRQGVTIEIGNAEMARAPRVFMLGIDAMSLPFARAHLDKLPTLKALLDRGVLVELDGPGKHLSASVWASFASGTDVGEHGQYFPFQWDAKCLKLRRTSEQVWRRHFSFQPFWHEFARDGIASTVLDAGSVLGDGAAPCHQVSNWSYQSSGDADASDPALLKAIRRRFGYRPIGREVPVPKKRALCVQIRDAMISAMERKTDAILWLMARDPWRFFLAGYYEVHRAGHNLWPVDGAYASEADPDALLEVYKAQDRALANLLACVEDKRTTLILFALHGMGPNAAQDHFLDTIISRLNACYLKERGFSDSPRPGWNLASWLRRSVPFWLQYRLANILGERIQDWVVNRAKVGGIDWPRTPAFDVTSGGEGLLRLNIKGRETKGFFEPESEELDSYVVWLKRALMEIRVVGTGAPLVDNVLLTRDIFPGPGSSFLPDLIVKWAPEAPVEHVYSEKVGDIRRALATGRGGNHRGDAFVLVTGPGAALGAIREIADIRDIGKFARACLG